MVNIECPMENTPHCCTICESWCVPACWVASVVQLSATPWTVAHQTPLSMGFSRQEYWSGLPCPPPGALPSPRMKPMSPGSSALQADSVPLSHQGSPMNHGSHLQNYLNLYNAIKGVKLKRVLAKQITWGISFL